MNTHPSCDQSIQTGSQWMELPCGQRRFMHSWSPTETSIKGKVFIVHGLGEHGGRYIRLAPHLARHGYHVTAIDLQGHGLSPGNQGQISSYDSLLDEVEAGLSFTRANDSSLPCFLLGHSMGANLAANYILQRQQLPQAAVLSSPMFLSPREPKGLMNIIARTALRIVPNHTVYAGTETKQLMDDPAEQQILDNDPLFHRRISLRLGAALIDQGRWAIENAARLAIPTLVTHGSLDKITKPEGSQQFAYKAGKLCQLKLLEGHLHESFRDQRRQQVIQLFLDFFDSHSTITAP